MPPRRFDPNTVADRFTKPVSEITAAPVVAESVPDVPPDLPPEDAAGHEGDDKKKFSWAQLRKERNTFEAELRTERQRLADLESEKQRLAEEKAALAEETQKYKQEAESLSETVGRLNLAESPQFKQKYDQKAVDIEARLAGHLTRYARVSPEEAEARAREFLTMSPADLAEATSELNPSVAGVILTLAGDLATLDEARNRELQNWRQTAASLGVQQARENVVQTAERKLALALDALDAAAAAGNPVLNSDDPEAKEVAASLVEAFKGFAQGATDDQLMRAAAEGFTAPYLYEVLNQQAETIRELQNAIASRNRASAPPLYPASPSAPVPQAPAPASNAVPVRTADSPEQFAKDFGEGIVNDMRAVFQGG